jgi:hypothetical protein
VYVLGDGEGEGIGSGKWKRRQMPCLYETGLTRRMTMTRMTTKKPQPLLPGSPTKNKMFAAFQFSFEKILPMDLTKLDAKDYGK